MDTAEADGHLCCVTSSSTVDGCCVAGYHSGQAWLAGSAQTGGPPVCISDRRIGLSMMTWPHCGTRFWKTVENVVRLLNNYITSLIHLRDEIDENDRTALLDRWKMPCVGRIRWFDERNAADWLSKDTEIDAPLLATA
jgi:hypothetical protein